MAYLAQKRIAAQILKCGISRVRIKSEKEVAEALTREDIRRLIRKGIIYKIQAKGTSKAFSKKRAEQKQRGRRKGPGSRKGVRAVKKQQWIKRIRALRRLLSDLRAKDMISKEAYNKLYKMAKGGAFRTKQHLLLYARKADMIKAKKVSKHERRAKVSRSA
ncbi:MAG: 50S ribosomal protein L19e [Candidatus Aenigmatarchaeota archaeon]